jgi:hypothetical protein
LTTLWQDVLYGLRMLGKKPGFTAIAVVSLGLPLRYRGPYQPGPRGSPWTRLNADGVTTDSALVASQSSPRSADLTISNIVTANLSCGNSRQICQPCR